MVLVKKTGGKIKAKREVLHYPQLDSVLMVEDFLQNMLDNYTKKQVWLKLPKKMMYQTFCVILDYLERSNKITYDVNGNVVWIFYYKDSPLKNLQNSVEV